jgi:hypothetical protein
MAIVRPASIPPESQLYPSLAGADFYDAYEAALSDTALPPTELFLRAFRATPPWVNSLMSVRNNIVKRLGLKDTGAMGRFTEKAPADYHVGDRLGIFSIFSMTPSEVVVGIDDKHLDVRVSVRKSIGQEPRYIVATVVKIHNLLGRVYMVPVGRIHPFVVRALMRRAKV